MCRVIVAEDDPEMRRLVVEALRKDGHQVTEAADGGRLLVHIAEAFDRDPSLSLVDVIVSDVRMPICTGLELLERLADARWRVPMILMTAFGDEDTRRRAERLGAILFDKPLSLDALRAAVNRLGGGTSVPAATR
ncbi:MAG TPA: response regulator [Polyangiaceae bacterium]